MARLVWRLFETTSGKWIELNESGNKFHTSKAKATEVQKDLSNLTDQQWLEFFEKNRLTYLLRTIIVIPEIEE